MIDIENLESMIGVENLKRFVIECQDNNGKTCWVIEKGANMLLTDDKEQATIYYGELDVGCALLYFANQQKLVCTFS